MKIVFATYFLLISLYFVVGTPVVRNNLHQTLPLLHKQYRLSFEVYPTGTIANSFASIIQVGLGGWVDVYGDRTPAISFKPGSTELHITSSVNSNNNYIHNTPAIPLNKWTKVEVSQIREFDGYHYTIAINGLIVNDVINTDARTFANVKVSSS